MPTVRFSRWQAERSAPAQADSRGRQVATIAAQGKEISALESKLRQAERLLAASQASQSNELGRGSDDDDGAMQRHHSSIEASVGALEELVRASLESARCNRAEVHALEDRLAGERSRRSSSELAKEAEKVKSAQRFHPCSFAWRGERCGRLLVGESSP